MKKTLIILTIPLLIILLSCNQREIKEEIQPKNELKEAPAFTFNAPYILDYFPSTEKTLDTNEMLAPYSKLVYKGSLLDTINLKDLVQNRYKAYWNNSSRPDSSVMNEGLKLFTSPNQDLSIPLSHFFAFEPTEVTVKEDGSVVEIPSAYSLLESDKNNPDNYIQSRPVFIINTSKDTVFLEHQDESIMMIQEAKDEHGVWRPIEFWKYSFCGNSYGTFGISPNNGVLVKIYKYNGDFETNIRLKLKNGEHIFYSDSFKGKINKEQFNPPTPEEARAFRDSTSWFY